MSEVGLGLEWRSLMCRLVRFVSRAAQCAGSHFWCFLFADTATADVKRVQITEMHPPPPLPPWGHLMAKYPWPSFPRTATRKKHPLVPWHLS